MTKRIRSQNVHDKKKTEIEINISFQDIEETHNYHRMSMYVIIKSNMPSLGVNFKLIRCK